MGFNILDKDGKQIGWAASEFENDSDLQFIDDTVEIVPDIGTLKVNKITNIKQQATKLVSDTDWKLQRAVEQEALGIDGLKPLDIYIQREGIRQASNRIEEVINSLEDIGLINTTEFTVLDSDYPVVNK